MTLDGSLVVGTLYSPSVSTGDDPRKQLVAGIWTDPRDEMVPLETFLEEHLGLQASLEGWHLRIVREVTDDGRYMAGYAINPDGEYEAFLLDLGLRGDLDGDEQLDITDINQLTDAIAGATDDLKFDVNWSGTIDETDLDYWVHSAKKTFFGDANLDGQFNAGDLVQVLGAGKYETQEHAGWGEGDWNDDSALFSLGFIIGWLFD